MTEQSFELTEKLYTALLNEATQSLPNECVGLIFKSDSEATQRSVALNNIATRPQVEYHADPKELLQALKTADANGDELIAIYHSHPTGPAHPSQRDIAKAYYDVPSLIVLPQEKALYAFNIIKKEDGRNHPRYRQLKLKLI